MEAYFAGGCFWCMAKPYNTVPGVLEVESGYCGGTEADAVYERVKKQQTMHRETVKLVFDPSVISFDELLQVYFYNIDPFDGGGQFIDRGRSYTCAVYWTDGEQRDAAENAIAKIENEYGKRSSSASRSSSTSTAPRNTIRITPAEIRRHITKSSMNPGERR